MKLLLLVSGFVFLAQPNVFAIPPTYNRDIAPITNNYCAPCHRPGEAGPFSLLTYSDVKLRAAQIGSVTRSRYMPPWLPDINANHFADERRLTDAQIEIIQQWIAAGAPEGPPAEAPKPPRFTQGWQLGPPDLIVKASTPFAVPASGRDVFWNFVLRSPVDRTRYVKAIEIRPGDKRLVHHANLLVDRARTSRSRESSPGAGFGGMDLEIESATFDPDSHFLFWKPGSAPYVEPPGLAWRLAAGEDLVLNVHFQTSGKPEQAQPEVGLYFTDQAPDKFPMLVQLEHDGALDIPAGDNDFHIADDFRLPMDVNLLAVYPHAHYLGKNLEGFATLPDGSRRSLVRIADWDLNWQAVYRYREPLFLPRGTLISMRYTYDNSAANIRNPHHPPERVRGGNQSTDEMGHLWLQVLPVGAEDQRPVLQEALMRHRLEKYPGDFSAEFNLGALLLVRERPAEAQPFLQSALRSEPDQPAALTAFGAALLSVGDTKGAEQQFQHALRADPTYANARYNLGSLLANKGDLRGAAAAYREVLRETPGDERTREKLFGTLSQLANEGARNGQTSDATRDLREALGLFPDSADAHNNLGVFLIRQGDRAGAVAEFQTALRYDPAHREARRNLDLAQRRTP